MLMHGLTGMLVAPQGSTEAVPALVLTVKVPWKAWEGLPRVYLSRLEELWARE